MDVSVVARTNWVVEGVVDLDGRKWNSVPDVVGDVHVVWEDGVCGRLGVSVESVVLVVVCRHWFIFCGRWRCSGCGRRLVSLQRLAGPNRRSRARVSPGQLALQHLHRLVVQCRW